MQARDPRAWATEPVRRALDGVLYRWLALFCAPVAAAAVHRAFDAPAVDQVVHTGLPMLLAAYVAVHLGGRPARRRGTPDGWARADDLDHSTVALARTVGWVTVLGAGLALIAPSGTIHDPKSFLMEVLTWFPLLFPLYALAVWATIDCARDRLGRGAEESRRRLQAYWQGLGSGRGRGGAPHLAD